MFALGIAASLFWYCAALGIAWFVFVEGIDGGRVFATLVAASILVLPVSGLGAIVAAFALMTDQRNRRLTILALCINAAPFVWIAAAKMGVAWPNAQ